MKSPLRRLSLQTKLLISFFIVIVLATIGGYWFINRSVNRAFTDFAVRSVTIQDRMLIQLIISYYNRTGTFEGVAEILGRGPRGIPFFLVDPNRTIVFAPDPRFVGRRLDGSQVGEGQKIVLQSGEIWTVLPYVPTGGRSDELEEAFLRAIRRALWLGGCAAGVAGFLLSLFLLRQTTSPLRRLEAATRRITEGHFDERVNLQSPDEIGRLAESFNEMAASLESAEQTKRQMIADISHELRTPLSAVRSALEGLRDGLIEPTQEAFTALHNRVLLFTRLVNDLHQLTLADAGQLTTHRQPTLIGNIVEGILDTIGAQLEDAEIALEQSLDPDLPNVDVDPHRIEQVFLNLLSNAIRHTPKGGVIRFLGRRGATNEVVLSVCDNGPGLRSDELERVFDRFYRADEARASEGGAGLGLAIAKALVEAHGGRIWAENVPEGGACFHVTLPEAQA